MYSSILRLKSQSTPIYVRCNDDEDKIRKIGKTGSECKYSHPSVGDDVGIRKSFMSSDLNRYSEKVKGKNKNRLPLLHSTDVKTNDNDRTCGLVVDFRPKVAYPYIPIIDDDIDDMSS